MRKKKLILIIILVCMVLLLLSIIFLPSIIERREINNLEKEISIVDNYIFKNKGNIKDINKYIDKDITSGKRKKVEKSLDKYLKYILKNSKDMIDINNDDKINKCLSIDKIIDTDNLDYLKEVLEKLNGVKDKFKDIDKSKYIKTKDKYSLDLYNRLINKKMSIDKLNDNIDKKINDIDNMYKLIEILNNNKDNWSIEEGKIIFKKRKIFNEYKDIIDKIKGKYDKCEYSLISDKEGPIITASDITIYKGNNINIKDNVKCVDLIDDNIECKISGNYDINKIGTYNINISAIDIAGNSSSKDIKLFVKEKNYKPYYIEIVRNYNTVIVYGLDNNKEYTNIVKVFPCSVGKNNQTPLGTYTTSKGYEWGSLYGGVYGQYSTRIVNDILFHSVPYNSMNKNDLEWEEFNKLGEAASMGCIRMTVRDVKWIYDNCSNGTIVKIYDGNLPKGVSKPSAPKIDGNSPNRGWDPTDPDPNNPWN